MKLEPKRYDIDGDNLYATISEYNTKNEETTKFEAHRKYIDIQYVIKGKEIMNLTPRALVKDVVTPYDSAKDIEFMNVEKMVNHTATPAIFFIFFPTDAHRPGIKDGVNAPVRKIVIKVKVD
jgi:YhcH/YjgK/YiaL family protein